MPQKIKLHQTNTHELTKIRDGVKSNGALSQNLFQS